MWWMRAISCARQVSIVLEEAALARMRLDEPASAAELDNALAPTAVKGWRALDVSARSGGECVGILSAVCLPLASLPLLNVSTLEHSFVLVREEHLEIALERLAKSFTVVR